MSRLRLSRSIPMRSAIVVLGLLLALLMQGCTGEGSTNSLDQRAQALDQEIMCPVCPGESIDQSRTEYAKQMRAFVREKLAEGWSEEQIKQYYVDRFGPRILLAPPQEGFTLTAWLLPPLGFAAGLAALAFTVRRMRHTGRAADGEPPGDVALSDEEQREYIRRVEAALDNGPRKGPARKEWIDG